MQGNESQGLGAISDRMVTALVFKLLAILGFSTILFSRPWEQALDQGDSNESLSRIIEETT
jgi:hypothetical protein